MRSKGQTAGSVLARVLGLLLLVVAACAPPELPPEEAIVGKWVNAHGGTIFFYDDQSGFMPGDETLTPPIPDARFTYYFENDTHVAMKIDEQDPVTIEIELQDDKLTWILSREKGIAYEYARVRDKAD